MELLQRQWVWPGGAAEGEDGPVAGYRVSVMQWNTLADALSDSSLESNFFQAPPECLAWSVRSRLLVAEVLRSRADIVCLEEVDHFADWVEPQLKGHGFAGLFLPKPASPCLNAPGNSGPDGCVLFYRTVLFELQEKREVALRGPGGEASNQVALLARLGWRGGGAERGGSPLPRAICVAVTHLKAKREFCDYRLAQGQHLKEEVASFAGDLPAIVCGDFNASPREPVYEFFTTGKPELASAYAVAGQGGEPELTSWKLRPSGEAKYTIDYIWFTPCHLTLAGLWSLPSQADIGPGALPCPAYPSDHLSLCASFLLHCPDTPPTSTGDTQPLTLTDGANNDEQPRARRGMCPCV